MSTGAAKELEMALQAEVARYGREPLQTILNELTRPTGDRNSYLTPDILLCIQKKLKMSDRDDIVFWAACLVTFFSLFRKANLFAKKQTKKV